MLILVAGLALLSAGLPFVHAQEAVAPAAEASMLAPLAQKSLLLYLKRDVYDQCYPGHFYLV